MQQKTEIPWPPPFSSWMPPDSRSRPPPPPPSGDSESFVIRLIIAFAFSLLAVFLCSSCCKGYRNIQARAAAAAATERRTRQDPRARNGELLPPPARPRLPAFKYDRSVKHNVTGGGEEAKTCSVCLGAFQLGETVRLLPACLHLYHAECIDPWLDAHSTCPICRSDTDPTMGVGRPPPV